MKITELIGKRFKEKPSETKLKSHEFLIRGGYVRSVASGIFVELLPGLRVARNIENIIRNEMNDLGANEVAMPLVTPAQLWRETGRYDVINGELLKFKDRNSHEMLLAMTHEETVTAVARAETSSYREYPFSIYQFGKKFRDEARPRGGQIRAREFTMKDAYSFHTSQESVDEIYEEYAKAYHRIFAQVGIPQVVSVKSDSGMMGGKIAHEYMLLCDDGEDTIITCDKCDYRANREVAESRVVPENPEEEMAALEKIETPNAKTIEEVAHFLKMSPIRMIKTVVYKPVPGDDRVVVVMVRGDREVNEAKLSKVLRAEPEFADDTVFENTGMVPGYASGLGARNVRVIVDKMLTHERNMVTGANEKGIHLCNFNISRDLPNAEIFDVVSVASGDICKQCGGNIKISRGIEVGNIFQLGEKYTKAMGMTYTDENGEIKTPLMGCYGIGIGRLVASVIEARNDERGPIWPVSIAPWPVSLTVIYSKTGDDNNEKISNDLYTDIKNAGIEILFDDRKISAGEKFADIDLLGVPLQLVLSPKTIEMDSVEWKNRATGEKGLVKIKEVLSWTQTWLKNEEAKLKTFE